MDRASGQNDFATLDAQHRGAHDLIRLAIHDGLHETASLFQFNLTDLSGSIAGCLGTRDPDLRHKSGCASGKFIGACYRWLAGRR